MQNTTRWNEKVIEGWGLGWKRAAVQKGKSVSRVLLRVLPVAGLLIGVPALHARASTDIAPAPRIQLALLLDTSNSMDGLISQAKSRLWQVANEFVGARRGEARPILEVALFEYGNSGLNAEGYWVRQVLPFTTDLDLISEMLFGLNTNGGEELCGVVMGRALDDLHWSASPVDLKTIFIAGNEPFNQGHADYRTVCARARAKDIVVNTIFCGERQEGVATYWQDGAALGGGRYLHIDQNREIRHIEAPQDAEIEKLGRDLNGTYLPYGVEGSVGAKNQIEQDSNAASLSRSVNVERQKVKGSRLYSNDTWDLVDGVKSGSVSIGALKSSELPEVMRSMSPEERVGYVESKRAERRILQERIQALSKARDTYLAEARKREGDASPDGLDAAMIEAVHAMAEPKGYVFE